MGYRSMVRGRGLEPPCLAALAPKASVSAISPPAHFKAESQHILFESILTQFSKESNEVIDMIVDVYL